MSGMNVFQIDLCCQSSSSAPMYRQITVLVVGLRDPNLQTDQIHFNFLGFSCMISIMSISDQLPPSTSSSLARQDVSRRVLDERDVDDLNTISNFLSSPAVPLSHSEISSSSKDGVGGEGGGGGETVYVLAGSAILPLAEALYNHIESLLYPHSHGHGHGQGYDHGRDTDAEDGPEAGETISIQEHKKVVRLIIAGGIGHSTKLLYDAISNHPLYSSLSHQMRIEGSSESSLLRGMLLHHWPLLAQAIESGKLHLEIDEKSTNCGANAVEAKRILDKAGIWPRKVVVVQDPTMHRRTLAGFEKIYLEDLASHATLLSQSQSQSQRQCRDEGARPSSSPSPSQTQRRIPELVGWTFNPNLSLSHHNDNDNDNGPNPDPAVSWTITDPSLPSPIHSRVIDGELWSMDRFISLVLGEIPRLRDDEEGYGPLGKGFITHVDIHEEVEMAWERLSASASTPKR